MYGDFKLRVYVMRGLDSGLLKIGHSRNLKGRLRGVASTIEPVELLAAFPGARAVERAMHRRFGEYLAPDRGQEWFRAEGRLAAWVESMPAEYRASGRCEVMRTKPHFAPEQAAAMRAHTWGHKTQEEERAAREFHKRHRHPFAPVSYLLGCWRCARIRDMGLAAPVTAVEAMRFERAADELDRSAA